MYIERIKLGASNILRTVFSRRHLRPRWAVVCSSWWSWTYRCRPPLRSPLPCWASCSPSQVSWAALQRSPRCPSARWGWAADTLGSPLRTCSWLVRVTGRWRTKRWLNWSPETFEELKLRRLSCMMRGRCRLLFSPFLQRTVQ